MALNVSGTLSKKNLYELCSYAVFGMFCLLRYLWQQEQCHKLFLVAISITHKKEQQQQK